MMLLPHDTARLRFGLLDERCAEAMFALNDDPDVIRYTGDTQFENVAAAAAFFKQYVVNNYEKYGVGRYLVYRKSDDALLGWCGLKYIADTEEFDVGYRLYQQYWGNGYATEAAFASLRFGFEDLKLESIIANVAKDNIASIGVIEKLGMQKEMEMNCGHDPGYRYRITKDQFFVLLKDA